MKRTILITLILLPLMLLAHPRIGIVNSKQIFDLTPAVKSLLGLQ